MANKIEAEKREIKGKGLKALRRKGLVPAVIFDSKTVSEDITVKADEIMRIIRGAGATTIFDVVIGGTVNKAVIKELQTNPVSEEIMHVSFFKIDENAEMDFELSIVLTGISPAVKNNLGVLVQPFESVMIRCKPQDLIDSLNVDISKMEHPGQTIKLSEVALPKGIKLVHKEDIDNTIVTITELQKEEEIKPVTSAEGEEGAEGETVEGEEGAEGEATEGAGSEGDKGAGGDKAEKKKSDK